ncbi:STT3 domain-containing protein [Calditerrivibrio nitroreducens]|uniref:Oligosaccharyl transferase STT3 subunit n=1 Tax=Calditerrivibrio nitroreducens (strain DSM 19672 / NBRC 101217 / Yu37-1) TaxID=768670 RepID=E4TIT5_CALNY|nr:STT3 domain-containing protein [Calditerrivibrio nitroreducens]ADR18040.1 Oligosaccharyl transferase STT3 subunit [Calditerrivibrio nitroreducens DSM 19672]
MKKLSISMVLLIVFIAITFGISTYKRFWQLSVWNTQKEATYARDGRISMTTLDAYYWTRLAKEFNNGKFGDNKTDPLKSYPDHDLFPSYPSMLVFLLAKLPKLFSSDLYITGICFTSIFAGLFIIPLGIYFYRIGLGLVGIAGGLFGTFSYAYYVRSCNGRVDTDSLLLFFPIIIGLFFLMITQTEDKKKQYIYAGLAGFFMLLMNWWYQHYGFAVVYGVLLVVYLLIYKFKIKDIAILTGIYILLSNPLFFIYGIGNLFDFVFKTGYFHKTELKLANISWPNIMETISESNKKNWGEILSMILGNPKVAALGIIGIFAAFILKFKQMIPLLPLLGLGMLAFISGNRFSMFLAPLAGAGLAYILFLILYYGLKYLKMDQKINDFVLPLVIYLIFFGASNTLTAYNVVLPPSIPTPIQNSFLDIKDKVPKGSPVFTWWDFGYALMDIGEFSVYHDGGVHGADRSYFTAKAFVETDQKKMYGIISAIDNFKFEGINKMLDDNKSANSAVQGIMNYNGKPKNKNIIVLYTSDMIGKYGALAFFGNWDFEKKVTKPEGYRDLTCKSFDGKILQCENAILDTETGLINKQVPIKRFVITQNGKLIQNLEYPHSSDITIQLVAYNNNLIGSFILTETVYRSNFNQMYLLGNYDTNLFEEIYNNFPHARAFRVKVE